MANSSEKAAERFRKLNFKNRQLSIKIYGHRTKGTVMKISGWDEKHKPSKCYWKNEISDDLEMQPGEIIETLKNLFGAQVKIHISIDTNLLRLNDFLRLIGKTGNGSTVEFIGNISTVRVMEKTVAKLKPSKLIINVDRVIGRWRRESVLNNIPSLVCMKGFRFDVETLRMFKGEFLEVHRCRILNTDVALYSDWWKEETSGQNLKYMALVCGEHRIWDMEFIQDYSDAKKWNRGDRDQFYTEFSKNIDCADANDIKSENGQVASLIGNRNEFQMLVWPKK